MVGALGALPLGLGVCVCAVWPFVLVWLAWGGSRAVWLLCVCVRVLVVCCWWGVSYLGWFSSSVGMVVFKKQKKRSCRRVAEMRGMRDAYYVPLYLSHRVFFPCRERECVQVIGGLLGCFCVLCLVSTPFTFFFRSVFDNIPLCLAFPLYRGRGRRLCVFSFP